MNDMKPIVINKQEIEKYSYQSQISMLTVSRTAVSFSNKAVEELKLQQGSQFTFVFDTGLLFLKLAENDSNAFVVNKILKKGNTHICTQMNIQLVLKKYTGTAPAKRHRYQIGQLKAGMYLLSFIAEETKKNNI